MKILATAKAELAVALAESVESAVASAESAQSAATFAGALVGELTAFRLVFLPKPEVGQRHFIVVDRLYTHAATYLHDQNISRHSRVTN